MVHPGHLLGERGGKWIWRDKFICFFLKDFYPSILILKYCLCQLYHFLRPFLFELYQCINFVLISRAVFESPNTALRELHFLNMELLHLSMILLLEFLPKSQIDFQLLLFFILLIGKLYLNISTLLCNYLLFYF